MIYNIIATVLFFGPMLVVRGTGEGMLACVLGATAAVFCLLYGQATRRQS